MFDASSVAERIDGSEYGDGAGSVRSIRFSESFAMGAALFVVFRIVIDMVNSQLEDKVVD